jgi:cytochrome c oxidase subunit 2
MKASPRPARPPRVIADAAADPEPNRSFVTAMRIESVGQRSALGLVAAGIALACGNAALAAGTGQPEPWQIAMQNPMSEVARDMHLFHTWLVWIITAITLLVLALLIAIAVKFNERANPVPTRTTHNTLLEVAWTIVPVLILVVIAIPSFRLLREQLIIPPADLVIKTTGNSWYWTYEYLGEQAGFRFDANMVQQNDLKPGQPRLLATDNDMVVPLNKVVKLQVTASDVLHAFALPSFGLKIDAVPGRLNETWFKPEREGIYYGQCSELCGNGHPYMPIAIRVVSEQAYAAWLAEAKQKFASTSGRDAVKLAASTR